MQDNAIVRGADPDLLATIADRLDERILQQRANYWATRLAPPFSARERARCQLAYQWSLAQIEFARDVIFKRRAQLHDLFQRAVEIGVTLGGASQPRHIFERHINRRYQGKLETVLERRDEGFPVLRSYTLGQLRYDLGKLRAHRLTERVGTSRRYRLTADGVHLGALLVEIRTRLLGSIFGAPSRSPAPRSDHPSSVEAALRTVDHALDHLCHTLRLTAA